MTDKKTNAATNHHCQEESNDSKVDLNSSSESDRIQDVVLNGLFLSAGLHRGYSGHQETL